MKVLRINVVVTNTPVTGADGGVTPVTTGFWRTPLSRIVG